MSIAQALAVVLMLRVARAGRPALRAHLVDAGQSVQEPAKRRAVPRHVAQVAGNLAHLG